MTRPSSRRRSGQTRARREPTYTHVRARTPADYFATFIYFRRISRFRPRQASPRVKRLYVRAEAPRITRITRSRDRPRFGRGPSGFCNPLTFAGSLNPPRRLSLLESSLNAALIAPRARSLMRVIVDGAVVGMLPGAFSVLPSISGDRAPYVTPSDRPPPNGKLLIKRTSYRRRNAFAQSSATNGSERPREGRKSRERFRSSLPIEILRFGILVLCSDADAGLSLFRFSNSYRAET